MGLSSILGLLFVRSGECFIISNDSDAVRGRSVIMGIRFK